MKIAKTETKANTFHHFEEVARLNIAAVVLYERNTRAPWLEKKMECNYVMMSWGGKWQRKIVIQSMMDVVLPFGTAGI